MIVEEVLVEVFKASPRDRAQQWFLVQITSTLLFLTLVEEMLGEVFTASPRDRAQQQFLEQITSTLLFLTVVEEVLVEVFTASPRDRAQQRFVEQNMLTLLFLMVVLEREVFAVFPEDSIPQRLPVSRPSFLLVEVFMKVFKVEDRSEVLRTRLEDWEDGDFDPEVLAEAERQIEAGLSERLEQSHPGAWAPGASCS